MLDVYFRHDVEKAIAGKQTVGHQGVQVRVKIKVFAKRVDAHDDAGKAVGLVQGGLHVFQQAFVGDAAVILEQGAIEAEIRA